MKKYRILIHYEEIVEAKDRDEAQEKLAWEIAPRMADLNDHATIEEVGEE